MTADTTNSTFAASLPRQASFIVYINGIEVPAKSVSLRHGVWQIPEMQVSMVADPVLVRLGAQDRVQVAVFYLDDCDVSSGVEPAFRMFGEGEITGWGYRNTPRGREIVFTVVNQIAVFTQLFVQFMTSLDDMIGHLTYPGTGVSDTPIATSQLVYPYVLFQQGLLPGAGQAPATITRPFDFLYNAVRGMISSIVPTAQETVPAANFFTRWARLTNFHNRFMATPFFDEVVDNPNIFPALRALQDASAADVVIRNLIPHMQNAGSIWDMLQMVYTTVLMEIAMIPAMPLVTVDLASSLVVQTDFSEHRLDGTSGIWTPTLSVDSRKTKPKRLVNYFAKPQSLFGIPPTCNVVFPAQLKSMAYDENYATQPTRLYFNDETVPKVLKIQKTGMSTPIQNALMRGWPLEVDEAAQARDQFPNLNAKNFLLYPEEFFKGPVMDRRDVPPWLFFLQQSENKNKANALTTNDGAVATQPPPAQTGTTSVPTSSAAFAGAMTTNEDVGQVGANSQRVYSQRVEALRPRAERYEATTGIPSDLQLAWISVESGGNLDEVTNLNERGFFQIMGPHVANGHAVPLAQVEAGEFLGLTLADTGKNASDPPGNARLSFDADFSFQQGIRLVQAYRQKALAIASRLGLAWSDGDLWRLTKLYHALPAAAAGSRSMPSFIQQATSALGRLPASWDEMYKAIAGSISSGLKKWLDNATAVGGVVAGASGTMTTQKDKIPVASPPASKAPATPGAAASRATVPTPPASPTIPPSTYTSIQAQSLTVYQLYAKYEYFRERYAKRSGSAVISWNPYIVPGFPGAIFDERSTRVDLFCYITTVQQLMSNDGQRSTSLSFLYGRQFQEMFDLMASEFAQNGAFARGSAPQEPLLEVSNVVQSFTQAETYYQRLFYGAQRLYGKDAAFDFRKIVGYAPVETGGSPEPIFVDGPDSSTASANASAAATVARLKPQLDAASVAVLDLQARIKANQAALAQIQPSNGTIESLDVVATARQAERAQLQQDLADQTVQLAALQTQVVALGAEINAALSTYNSTLNTSTASGASGVSHNLDGTRELVPLPSAQALFESRDAAMRYNWRPICTLDEYIVFYNSAGEGLVPAFGHPQSVGVKYYDRIRRIAGPADNFVPPTGAGGIGVSTVPGLTPDNFPQVAEDWDQALIAYKRNVLSVKAPRA